MKPTNSRLALTFRFCITELLTHLHRDAVYNIVFGFTNTRSSFYTPGDTYKPLKTLLAKHKNVGISLSEHNVVTASIRRAFDSLRHFMSLGSGLTGLMVE